MNKNSIISILKEELKRFERKSFDVESYSINCVDFPIVKLVTCQKTKGIPTCLIKLELTKSINKLKSEQKEEYKSFNFIVNNYIGFKTSMY